MVTVSWVSEGGGTSWGEGALKTKEGGRKGGTVSQLGRINAAPSQGGWHQRGKEKTRKGMSKQGGRLKRVEKKIFTRKKQPFSDLMEKRTVRRGGLCFGERQKRGEKASQ